MNHDIFFIFENKNIRKKLGSAVKSLANKKNLPCGTIRDAII